MNRILKGDVEHHAESKSLRVLLVGATAPVVSIGVNAVVAVVGWLSIGEVVLAAVEGGCHFGGLTASGFKIM
jgi:hypothetical protein